METFYYTSLKTTTPLGTLRFAATEKGLAMLGFNSSDMPAAFTRVAGDHHLGTRGKKNESDKAEWIESPEKLKPYVSQLEAYIAGKRKEFDFPLDLRGTEFQKRCWEALLAIRFGETRSYADIAKTVGSTAGFRAVGQANHRNPVAIVVPCHRVVTTAGTLGGYGGGLSTKRWLLEHEGHCMQQLKDMSQCKPSAQLQLLQE